MYPEICRIGPFIIYSYGLMLALGFMISISLAVSEAKRQKIDSRIVINLASSAMLSGVIGGRLFYVIENLSLYLKRPAEIIMLNHGGLSWYGGLILGLAAAILYLKSKRVPVFKFLDLIVPFVALAQAVGRLGCLLNGCCFGKNSVWGIYFTVHQAVLIPTQLYASLILIVIFVILRHLQAMPHGQGKIFYLYLLFYSIARFFIEFFRADNPAIFGNLSLFQIISVVIFCISAIALLLNDKKAKD